MLEKKIIKVMLGNESKETMLLLSFDEETETIYIYIEINGKKYNANAENYFTALQNLRSILEKQGVQICCNGAARNVYPSPMLLSMGDGYMAYKLFKGSNASMANLVNIFDYDNSLEWCTVSEQRKFYQEWLDSLKGE